MTTPRTDRGTDDVPEPTNRLTGAETNQDALPTGTPSADKTLTLPSMAAEPALDALPTRMPQSPPPPAPPPTPEPGRDAPSALPRSFGDYELLGEIARGGMGIVYRARHKGLDRLVALKMILLGPEATANDLERFAREARAAAALDHPNIVPVYDSGSHDERPFFTMALIDGASLQRRVEANGPPQPREAVRLMRPIVDALAYAHSQGVVHRDLKPHNVLLDAQGRPRVTDFGLARRVQEGQGLTRTGDVLGTPNYMAPEQALGEVALLGPAVDVYGLGGIFYFLLTGQPPFAGGTAVTVLCRLLDEAPRPPREIKGDVPPELEAICLKCLEKDQKDRYPSAAALGEALAAWEAQQGSAPGSTPPLAQPPLPRPQPAARRRRGLLLATAVVLVGGGGLLAIWAAGWPKPDEAPTPPTASAEGEPAVRPAPQTTPAVSQPAVPPAPQAADQRRQDRPPKDVVQPAVPPAPQTRPVVAWPELPKDLRHDFGLAVQLVGGQEGPDGLRVFREEQPARFLIETQRDAYVGIWTIAPDGTVVQLFPNEFEPDHLVRAGQPRPVPGNERYKIEATPTPAGKAEVLRVVAATRRWEPLTGEKPGGFLTLSLNSAADRQKFETHLRGFRVRPKAAPGSTAAKDEVAEALLLYRVLPR